MLANSLKIEEVVGEFVELRKAGSNYKGLCPFHQDNTPSFMVSPSKNICKCFVCGAGGNPISFYSKYKKISFNQAVGELAKKYKIPIKMPMKTNEQNENFEKYYKIMDEAHEFFKGNIFSNLGRGALDYLSKREVTPKIIKENDLGFALDKWQDLSDYLLNKGYEERDLITLGLAKKSENGRLYDAFRNRIIFPIYSPQGRVIAFGGRTLLKDDKVPKYINSPDTPIFKKGKNLYGFERNNVIRQKDYAMLMEGYMDVLSACLYGFNTAVAPLGTALTYEQGVLLKRYTENIILCFDSDSAGQMAIVRASLILKSLGFNIRVLILDGAKDPDEYLKKFGKEKFLEAIRNSKEVFDFLFEYYSKGYDLTMSSENVASITNFIDEFKDFFACVEKDLEKYLYLDKLASQLEVDKSILKETLITKNTDKTRKIQEYSENINEANSKIEKIKKIENIANKIEIDILYLCFLDRQYFKYFNRTPLNGSLIKKIFKFMNENDESIGIRFITEKIEFSELEKDVWKEIILRLTDNSHVNEKTIELLKDTFLACFRMEIDDFYKRIKIQNEQNLNLAMLGLRIKQVEENLDERKEMEELVRLYDSFKKLLQE